MNKIRSLITGLLVLVALSSCGGSDGSGGSINTSYPHLMSKPQVSYSKSAFDTSKYDVSITVEADGPDGVYSINLWIQSKTNQSVFASLELQYLGGTTWHGTAPLALPSGDYYLDSIMIEDADSFAQDIVKSSWYVVMDPSASYYTADQRETDWSTVAILSHQVGTSDIPVVNFTLP